MTGAGVSLPTPTGPLAKSVAGRYSTMEAGMSTTAIRSEGATGDARVGQIDMKLEVITLPVSDLDRAKEFYGGLAWRLDADFKSGNERAIQSLTGERDANWPAWYAEYMVRERSGQELPT